MSNGSFIVGQPPDFPTGVIVGHKSGGGSRDSFVTTAK